MWLHEIALLAVLVIGCSASSTIESSNESAESKEVTISYDVFKPITNSKPLRVLGFFPYNGYSHFIMFKPLMEEMARRGHQVTVVTPFPRTTPLVNYTDVDLSDIFPKLVDVSTFNDRVNGFNSGLYSRIKALVTYSGPQHCKSVFTHPKITALLSGGSQFDVVFTEIFATDCYLAVGYKLKAPTIAVSTTNSISWMNDYIGETSHPAFVPSHFLSSSFKDLSHFGDRLENFFNHLFSKLIYYFLVTRPSEAVIHEILGDAIPSLADLRHNVSLIMTNSHMSIFGSKPSVPRILPVGGIHLQPPDPRRITQDIKSWLDTAPKGVLLFSLGSLIMADSIPPRLLKTFIDAFAELKPLRVLWKYKSTKQQETPPAVPDNVKLVEWLPQVEVLSHPNVSAFLTHGGIMGIFESVQYGVPMIGLPLFADQLLNINRLQRIRCAVRLDHTNLKKEEVIDAVIKVTSDPKIRLRIKEVSLQFRDRPMSPLNTAIWWTEYIVRHGGAHHLESCTARLPLWQYALFDVIAVILILLSVIMFTAYVIIRSMFTFRANAVPVQTVNASDNKKEV